MISLFRGNDVFSLLLLLPYIILVRIGTFIYPEVMIATEHDSYLYTQVLSLFGTSLSQAIAAVVLIHIQSILVVSIIAKNRLGNETTSFAGVLYPLLIGIISPSATLTPILLGNLFLLLAVNSLFSSYKNPKAVAIIFNTGFFIGVATAFYTPFCVFILLGIIGLLILRSFKFLEKLQYFLGLFCTMLFLGTWRFVKELSLEPMFDLGINFMKFLKPNLDSNVVYYVFLVLVMMIILYVLSLYTMVLSKKNIQVQKKVDILYWVLLFSGVIVILYSPSNAQVLWVAAMPLSMILAIKLSDKKSIFLAEIFHLGLLVMVFIGTLKLIVI